jgi:NTP pyrophosphatase (non-canonical NTP hydrolase)
MHLNDYQFKAETYAEYKDPMYPYFGLAEEAGETLGVIAKSLRKRGVSGISGDASGDMMNYVETRLSDELGDVLWMLSACCAELGITLQDIAEMNLTKLQLRKDAGAISDEDRR